MRTPDDANARARDQLTRALEIIDPPEVDRERWTERIKSALVFVRPGRYALDEALHSKQGRAALERYRNALHETQASYAALDPSVRGCLAMETSAVDLDLLNLEILLKAFRPRPAKRPVDERTRAATGIAGKLLEMRGFELTTERKGKWHLLSQTFADTSRDLRHHLTAFRGGKVEKIVL